MQASQRESNSPLTTQFILCIGLYFVLHIILRVIISPALDYDEAEQALLSQWLQVGYTEQPPLYTWVQYALFGIFGKSPFAVTLLKNGLLFLTYLFVFLSGKEIFRDDRKAVLAACSLLFIPQICWESQRDMTHTTLVVCACSATLFIFFRLLAKPSTGNYLWLGLALTAGILGKANFFLFFTVCFLAFLSTPEGRRVILSRKFLASIALAVALSSPYLLWMVNNPDIVFSSSQKFKRGLEHYYLHGTWSLISNSFLFLTPFWAICLAIFPAIAKSRPDGESNARSLIISRYMLFFFTILLIVVLLFKVTYVKDRWLQPLLFAAPLFLFSRLPKEAVTSQRFKIYTRLAGVTCLAIYTAFTLRVVAASTIGDFSRLNYPFESMAASLQKKGWQEGLIISDNRFLAGNLRLLFPGSTAVIPDYHFEKNGPTTGPALIVWRADHSRKIPKELKEFVETAYGVNPEEYRTRYLKHPYLHGEKTVKMGTISLNLPANQ